MTPPHRTRMNMHREKPLILAVEPDKSQAAQLTGLISRRFDADLIVAESTSRALAAIGTRIPELVLIPPFLSPQDEATLVSTFRANAAAAHVEILTTPVLTSPEALVPQRRFLPRRKKRAEAEETGDAAHTAAFADRIASCLERMKEEREMREDPSSDAVSSSIDEPQEAAAEGDDHGEAIRLPASDEAPGAAAMDPARYGFPALLYRLHASTRTTQELS